MRSDSEPLRDGLRPCTCRSRRPRDAKRYVKHAFGWAAVFTQGLELLSSLESLDDQRVNSETALAAPIAKQIAVKVSYTVRYDHLPEAGFQDTDRIFTTGVQIAF